jgi:hypothetical protein
VCTPHRLIFSLISNKTPQSTPICFIAHKALSNSSLRPLCILYDAITNDPTTFSSRRRLRRYRSYGISAEKVGKCSAEERSADPPRRRMRRRRRGSRPSPCSNGHSNSPPPRRWLAVPSEQERCPRRRGRDFGREGPSRNSTALFSDDAVLDGPGIQGRGAPAEIARYRSRMPPSPDPSTRPGSSRHRLVKRTRGGSDRRS